MKSLSKYNQLGWAGLHIFKTGKAGPHLKSNWIKLHAENWNNRNRFNYIKPMTLPEFQASAAEFQKLKSLGVQCDAVWISEAQHEKNKAVSDQQWNTRIHISD